MEVTNQENFSRRLRYYQSMIDTDNVRSRDTYGYLLDSYIIFLMPFNPLDKGRKQYNFHLREDNDPSLE